MLSTTSNYNLPIDIDVGSSVYAIALLANGGHLVSGGGEGVRVWRVQDGKEIAAMSEAVQEYVQCVAVSKDGRLIAAGTFWSHAYVWDAGTRERVFWRKEHSGHITGVDFSPDSTRLLVAAENSTATIWDIATRRRALAPLRHESWVRAAKYSPQGDRIATATKDNVRVWDSSDGRLLFDIKVKVTPWYNTGLLWSNHSNDQLLVVSDGKIKQIQASTRSIVVDWQVPDNDLFSACIAQPQHRKFVAYAAGNTVTLWDGSTRAILARIQHTQYIRSIILSPDDQSLAIGGQDGKITVKSLAHLFMPFINITDVMFDSWKQDRLTDTEASLTETITGSIQPCHHSLSSRALVRAHLRHWGMAIEDAESSLKVRPSVIGYIAKSVALIGRGRKTEGCRVLDLAFRHCDPVDVDHLLLVKAVILFISGEHKDAISRVDHLIAMVDSNSTCYLVQAYMHLLVGNSHLDGGDCVGAIQSFERARDQVRQYTGPALLSISLISGWNFDHLDITIRQRLCEALYTASRTKEGVESLLDMVNTFEEEIYTAGFTIIAWVSDFTRRCLSAPSSDISSKAARRKNLLAAHDSLTLIPLLRVWAKSTIANGSWKYAFASTVGFTISRFTIYRVVFEYLEANNRMTDADECFRRMVKELLDQKAVDREQIQWVVGKLEVLGDHAMSTGHYDDAISEYSTGLSLDPISPQSLLIKRSEAYVARGMWEDALNDANRIITFDPSSPWGYERKHAALHKGQDYKNAILAFGESLSRMSDSADPDIRDRRQLYVNPEDTKGAIRRVVQDVIRGSPRVLINTISGQLCNKSEQAAAFESLPIFMKLISSATTSLDHAIIEKEVREYYRYATFSHTWEENEPLFEKVVHILVYDLDKSPTHDKLRMFCKIVRNAGLHWAWSDTCCINKADHFILQEALVAMFKWYQGSAVTIVFLRGIHSPSQRGNLVKSMWNTRAWTFQEYHASNVVLFYTEDWTLYMDLDIPNHKDSPEIISEMEEATRISARALMALRPGLDDIREKLSLASGRRTTYVEDSAYSLLGIFSISLPIVYGEEDRALGRLLAHLLTGSGDTRILAWTGKSGSFNSCLPADISVFNELSTSHIPVAIKGAEMEKAVIGLRTSSIDLQSATRLYDRLVELPIPFFAGQRMKISCITFKLGSLSVTQGTSEFVFRAQTTALGVVSIRTKEDLSQFDSLYLAHCWIDFLLDREPVGSAGATETTTTLEENTEDQPSSVAELPSRSGLSTTAPIAPQKRAAWVFPRFGRSLGKQSATALGDVGSLRPPSSLTEVDKEIRALQLIVRLRQPFGALLLTPTRQNAAEFRRVSSESVITVQVQENAPLNALIDNTRMLDVL